MSFPVYRIEVRRERAMPYGRDGRGERDMRHDPSARSSRSRSCVPRMKVPVYRVVLRRDRTLRVPRTNVNQPERAAMVAHALIGDRPHEHLVALLVNGFGDIVGATEIATQGSVSSLGITVRGIFTAAIAHNASAIILAHNHPSGSTRPSAEDLALTEKAMEAAAILGIPILDNLIVTMDPDRWASITC